MAATTGFLAAGQPAADQVGVGVGVVAGNGILAGNAIQIPITAVVAIQVCVTRRGGSALRASPGTGGENLSPAT